MDWSKTISALKGSKWYLILAVFLGFFLYLFKSPVENIIHLSTEKYLKDVPKRIDRDVIVNELLEELMYLSGADRAYIFRFHNGQNYFDGTHKLRMSCEYEVVRKGIQPQAKFLKDIPTSLYPKFISEVVDGTMYYEDIRDIKDATTRVTLRAQGVFSIAVAPYFDKNNNLIAMIGVDYVGKKANINTILERQKNKDSTWTFEYQKQRFQTEVNSIGQAMINKL